MVELLAPVGSKEALVAAVEAGADAVYLGGKQFGARAYAQNFSDEELADGVRYAHLKDVFVYITVNTLLDDSEIPALITYLQFLYEIGVDAILVQDVGVAKIARQVTPNMPLHASTQMTVYNLAGVQILEELGFTKVVLSRELSLADIEYICKNSSIDIEVFIHGALCVCYSGQCLMSSLIGGRSGNRGRCAQPCRLPYTLVDKQGNDLLKNQDVGQYLLSPKDLNTLEILPKLIDAGVVSLKIEGRMKRPEYVAVVVSTYRRAIDLYYRDRRVYNIQAQDQKDLAQIFNRDFTYAYLFRKEGRNMMSDRRPNNRGVRVGRVMKYNRQAKNVTVKLDEPIAVGDTVEFWVKVGGRVGTTITSIFVDGNSVQSAKPGDEATVTVESQVKPNDRVFKTFDAELMAKARSYFAGEGVMHPIPVDVEIQVEEGQPLIITMQDQDGFSGSAATQFLAEKARNRPLDETIIAKQIGRLGNTVYQLRNLVCNVKGEVMVPISEINEARRKAVDNLNFSRLTKFNRAPLEDITQRMVKSKAVKRTGRHTEIAVSVDTLDKAQIALQNGADVILFGGESYSHQPITVDDYQKTVNLVRKAGKKIILHTPRIIKEWQVDAVKADMALFQKLRPDSVSVSNIGTFYLLKDFEGLEPHADFSLNVYNSEAVDFYGKLGAQSITLSPELNFTQLEALVGKNQAILECIVHGYLEMMVSEYCVIGSYVGQLHTGKCSQACVNEEYWLKDRMGELFKTVTDQYCRMHILNAKELSMLPHLARFKNMGIDRIRIEGKSYTAANIGKITKLYREFLDGRDREYELINGKLDVEHDDITRGHYFRGVL